MMIDDYQYIALVASANHHSKALLEGRAPGQPINIFLTAPERKSDVQLVLLISFAMFVCDNISIAA